MRPIRTNARISLIIKNRARQSNCQHVDRVTPKGADYSLIVFILIGQNEVSQ